MSGFLQRLKERKLVQWAIAYVAGGFALLQGIDIIALGNYDCGGDIATKP